MLINRIYQFGESEYECHKIEWLCKINLMSECKKVTDLRNAVEMNDESFNLETCFCFSFAFLRRP